MKAIIVRPGADKVFYRGFRRHNQCVLSYRTRGKSTFFNSYPVNRRTLIKIWQTLHHNASHSPIPVAKKWRPVERRFNQRHMGSMWRCTSRFANTYTAHAWM